jgi:glycosyltransferase involved in cell wall biosynthesis
VSVVLTTYNRAASLPTTIRSILDQSLRDFELIVSDDCSPDNTRDVVLALQRDDDRIVWRQNEHNLGMPGNLNAGIAAASGEYVANLHDGDVYDPELLDCWAAALDRCPSAGFVFNAYRYLRDDGSEAGVSTAGIPPCHPGRDLLEHTFLRSALFLSPVWGTCMVRREAYDKVGLFDPRFGFWSDVDMWMRLCDVFDVAYVDEPLISLPSRATLPRQKGTDRREEQRTLERMFWAARMRHYADNGPRRALEVVKHAAFIVFARTARETQAQLERVQFLRPYVRRGPY